MGCFGGQSRERLTLGAEARDGGLRGAQGPEAGGAHSVAGAHTVALVVRQQQHAPRKGVGVAGCGQDVQKWNGLL